MFFARFPFYNYSYAFFDSIEQKIPLGPAKNSVWINFLKRFFETVLLTSDLRSDRSSLVKYLLHQKEHEAAKIKIG